MKTAIIFFTLIFICNLEAYSQVSSDVFSYDHSQEMPKFPGGDDSIWCVLERNFRYDILNSDKKTITFHIAFLIDTDGVSKKFKCLGTIPRDLTLNHTDSLKLNEIFRVLALLPKWVPAKQIEKAVPSWFYIPVKTPYRDFRCIK